MAKHTSDYFASIEKIVLGLKELLQLSPDSPKLKVVVKKLRKQLSLYFVLKKDEGYLAEVLDLFPNWHKRVRYLEEHCRGLVNDIHVIHDMLTNAEEKAHHHLSIWLVNFDRYQRKEANLLQDAYCLDLGSDHP